MALPQEILERFSLRGEPELRPALSLDWPALEDALPDRGLPHGVVELRAPCALAGATTIAIAAVRAALHRDARAWAAWVDPEATLHAPGLLQRGVDLARLVVVRPLRKDLARVATKVVAAGAFEVVVVDACPVGVSPPLSRGAVSALLVRRLVLGAERSGGTVLLLSDARARSREPWPVALRLELERDPRSVLVRVGKERHGRLGGVPVRVPLGSPLYADA